MSDTAVKAVHALLFLSWPKEGKEAEGGNKAPGFESSALPYSGVSFPYLSYINIAN